MEGQDFLPMVSSISMVKFKYHWISGNIFLFNYLGFEPARKLTKGKVYTVKVMLDTIGKINY
jgi:hypothetical protein